MSEKQSTGYILVNIECEGNYGKYVILIKKLA